MRDDTITTSTIDIPGLGIDAYTEAMNSMKELAPKQVEIVVSNYIPAQDIDGKPLIIDAPLEKNHILMHYNTWLFIRSKLVQKMPADDSPGQYTDINIFGLPVIHDDEYGLKCFLEALKRQDIWGHKIKL